MRDSVWSGPVLAGALVASAGLLLVLATQIEVTPPPPVEVAVEHNACTPVDVTRLRERIARMQRDMYSDALEKERRGKSDIELDMWRHEEIAKARRLLLTCPGADTNVDLCEGFDVAEAHRDLSFLQEVRAAFGQGSWYRVIRLRGLEMLTGMCAVTGARTWPSPPDPWLERERTEYRSHVRRRS